MVCFFVLSVLYTQKVNNLKIRISFGANRIISLIFINDNELNSILMALLCGNDIITANPVIAAAAVAKVRIFLRKRDTFACFITRGFDVKALSVHRSANG